MSDGTFLIHWDGLKSCVFIVSEKKCEKALARHVGRPSLGHTQTVEVETISVEVRCRLLARHLSHSKIQALLCVDKGDQRRCLRLTEDCKGMSGNLVRPYTMAISCYLLNHTHTHAHLVGHSGTSEAALQSLIPNHGMASSTCFQQKRLASSKTLLLLLMSAKQLPLNSSRRCYHRDPSLHPSLPKQS